MHLSFGPLVVLAQNNHLFTGRYVPASGRKRLSEFLMGENPTIRLEKLQTPKLQAPGSKLQKSPKSQAPKQASQRRVDRAKPTRVALMVERACRGGLGFGAWGLGGGAFLERGAWGLLAAS